MELHVWGQLGDLVSFSPDCLAAIWYVRLAVQDEAVKVYQSSNTLISPQLPALRHKGRVYGGFDRIVYYLKKLGYDLDNGLSVEERTKNNALKMYIESNVSVLSQYIMYINRDNFESVTRPLFSKLVPFPMQYNLPLQQRDLAKKQCEAKRLSVVWARSAAADVKKIDTVLSRTQELINGKRAGKDLLFSDAKENLRVLNKAKNVYDVVVNSSCLGEEHSAFLVTPTRISTSDLLLLGHLVIQTLDDFPAPVLKILIETQYEQLNEYKRVLLEKLHGIAEPVDPTPPDQLYSLANVIRSYVW